MKYLLSKRGFGILELAVAGVIGGIMMSAISRMTSIQFRAQRSIQSTSSFNATVQQLKTWMEHSNNCSNLLPPNIALPMPLVKGPANVPNKIISPKGVLTVNFVPTITHPIFVRNKVTPDYTVNTIRMTGFSLDSNPSAQDAQGNYNNYLVNFEILATKNEGANGSQNASVGGSSLYTKIPLYIFTTTSANGTPLFSGCSTSASNFNCPDGGVMTGTDGSGQGVCGSPIMVLNGHDPVNPFNGQMWLRTDL